MTTRLALALIVALTAACAGSVGRRGGLPDDHIKELPEHVAASYELFSQRCSRCHTLSRPLDADITEPAHWEAYVTRMRRTPGSGISQADAKRILVFLEYWAAQRKKESGS